MIHCSSSKYVLVGVLALIIYYYTSHLPHLIVYEQVKTVDGFQGQEKDVIIFSAVRCSESGGIGFLQDERRLNVAITRAKHSLCVVGSVSTLSKTDSGEECWLGLGNSLSSS